MKFNVGDKVVLDNLNQPNNRYEAPGINEDMYSQIGKTFTISSNNRWYSFKEEGPYGWSYREDWLRLVPPTIENILTKQEVKLLKTLNNEV